MHGADTKGPKGEDMKMEPLSLKTALDLVWWRNDCRETLRTPGFTTEAQQVEFHREVNKPDGNIYYWEFSESAEVIAVGGLVNIDWHNRTAEISLLVSPRHRQKGIGKEVAQCILTEAFYNMNIVRLYGEVYDCGAVTFWKEIFPKASWSESPHLKYWAGSYHGSQYFWIDQEDLWTTGASSG